MSNDATKLPPFELGRPGAERDTLIAAVLTGKKTATSSLLSEWQAEKLELPKAGDMQLMVDSIGQKVRTITITKVEVRELGTVDDTIALAEGEGFANKDEWRRQHEQLWLGSRYNFKIEGRQLRDDTKVVIEHFKVQDA